MPKSDKEDTDWVSNIERETVGSGMYIRGEVTLKIYIIQRFVDCSKVDLANLIAFSVMMVLTLRRIRGGKKSDKESQVRNSTENDRKKQLHSVKIIHQRYLSDEAERASTGRSG